MFRFAFLGLSLASPPLLNACSCGNIVGSCDRGWNSGDTIFLGKTVALDKLPSPERGAYLNSYSVRFTVEESFRGSSPPNGEVVVYTGSGGGDCGYPFVPGTSYFVGPSLNLANYAKLARAYFHKLIISQGKTYGNQFARQFRTASWAD